MVYNGKDLLKMNDLGVPLFLETPIYLDVPGPRKLVKSKVIGSVGCN